MSSGGACMTLAVEGILFFHAPCGTLWNQLFSLSFLQDIGVAIVQFCRIRNGMPTLSNLWSTIWLITLQTTRHKYLAKQGHRKMNSCKGATTVFQSLNCTMDNYNKYSWQLLYTTFGYLINPSIKHWNCPNSACRWAHVGALATYAAAEHCQTRPTARLVRFSNLFTTTWYILRGEWSNERGGHSY